MVGHGIACLAVLIVFSTSGDRLDGVVTANRLRWRSTSANGLPLHCGQSIVLLNQALTTQPPIAVRLSTPASRPLLASNATLHAFAAFRQAHRLTRSSTTFSACLALKLMRPSHNSEA